MLGSEFMVLYVRFPQNAFPSHLPEIHVRLPDLQTSAPAFSAPGLPPPRVPWTCFSALLPKLNQTSECSALCLANSRCAVTGDPQSPEQPRFQPLRPAYRAGSARSLQPAAPQPRLSGVTGHREPPSGEPGCVHTPPVSSLLPDRSSPLQVLPEPPRTEAAPGRDVLPRV